MTKKKKLNKDLEKSTNNIKKEIKNIKNNIEKDLNSKKDKFVENVNEKKKKLIEELKDSDKNMLDLLKKTKEKLFLIIDNIIKKLKNKKNKKFFYIIILTFLVLISLFFLFKSISKEDDIDLDNIEQTSKEEIKKYDVKINIDFTENWILSKYDVIMTIGDYDTVMKHGKSGEYEFSLEEGEYEIYFESREDSYLMDSITLEINSNLEAKYKIICHNNRIEIEEKYVDRDVELKEDELKISFNKSKFITKNYETVIKQLKKAGFTNIVEKPIYDWDEDSWLFELGEVKSVKIDGSDEFKRGDIFKKDVKVVVTYHLKQYDDPKKIKPPTGLDWDNYESAVDEYKKAGFINVSSGPYYTYGYDGEKDNEIHRIYVNDYAMEDGKSYDKNDNVYIEYYVIKEESPKEKLDEGYARVAFENYGEQIYRYGFKCHWWVGLITHEQSEDGTWFFKVEVTIENAYGNKYKTIAEGKVSGTNNNPVVKDFYVSS